MHIAQKRKKRLKRLKNSLNKSIPTNNLNHLTMKMTLRMRKLKLQRNYLISLKSMRRTSIGVTMTRRKGRRTKASAEVVPNNSSSNSSKIRRRTKNNDQQLQPHKTTRSKLNRRLTSSSRSSLNRKVRRVGAIKTRESSELRTPHAWASILWVGVVAPPVLLNLCACSWTESGSSLAALPLQPH